MYAFFIPPQLEKKDRDLLASSIAKVAQNFRFEAQVFHEQAIADSITKAYALKSTVFIPFGDSLWFDEVLTQSIRRLPADQQLPTFNHLTPPQPVPALKEQFMLFRLRQSMSVLAARRLNKRFLYRAGDRYFLDTIRVHSLASTTPHFSLALKLVNKGEITCDLEASELIFQAYHHADHDQLGLLYLNAQRPTIRGSEKIQSKQPLARFSSQIATSQHEPILRIAVKTARIQSSSDLTLAGQPSSTPLQIGALAEKITVIEAKNTLQ